MTQEATSTNADTGAPTNHRGFPLGRTLLWVGIAGASVALSLVALRIAFSVRREPPADETADRIQALIDEANRLIKTLDEKKQT